jgi:two-component system chemotaxis response regulator CheY
MAKILVMDDSMMMRSVLKNFLKKLGHDSVEAKDGDEVVEKYSSENPDAVFMDIVVPGGTDGWEATKKIKSIDRNAKIIMVTSLKEKSDEDNAKKLGAGGYVRKPFSMEEIKTALANVGIN